MTILVVDDDAGTRNALQACLTGAGHTVVLARDGQEALHRIASSEQTAGSIDLMVADYKMPGLNGLDLIRAVRQCMQMVPVIMMTAYGDNSTRNQVSGMGRSRYLEKPFEPEELVRQIEALTVHFRDGRDGL